VDLHEYYRAFRDLPSKAEEDGATPRDVVHAEATRLADPGIVTWAQAKVGALRRRHKWMREDAETAYLLLEAYYWDRQIEHNPLRGRVTRLLAKLMKLRYPRLITVEPDQVVLASPWGADCPLVMACKDDLDRCRTFCDACFAQEFILGPDEMAILRASAPTMRLALERYREKPRDVCRYAIVTEEENQGSEPLLITDATTRS
jgi:hypothetical protein